MAIISNVRIGTFCSLLFFWRNLPGVDLCGGYQNGATGTISFPESVSNYPPSTDCTWYVTAPYNADSFLLTFSRFDINDMRTYNHQTQRRECDDYLQILRADHFTMMHRCGKSSIGHGPLKKEVRGNTMTVLFHSDNINTGKGFSFTWKVNKWRSTTPQPATTTTTPQPTTTTTPQTTTTTTLQSATTAPQTTTPQTTTTTTPQPTTTTTTTPKTTTAKNTTTTNSATTTNATSSTTTTTKSSATITTTTVPTSKAPPTTASTTTLTSTTTSIKEAIATTDSATTCVPATFVENSTATPVANTTRHEDTPDFRPSPDSFVGNIIIYVCGFLAFETLLLAGSCILWRTRRRRRRRRYKTGSSPVAKEAEDAQEMCDLYPPNQNYFRHSGNMPDYAVPKFRLPSTAHVYVEIPLETENENPYADPENQYDVLRQPRQKTTNQATNNIYGHLT